VPLLQTDPATTGMLYLNDHGYIVAVNERACEITGRDPAVLCGSSYLEVLHPEDAERCAAAVASALRLGERGRRLRNRFQRPDLATVWVESSLNVLRDRAGEPSVVLSMAAQD
jgi:PAS domain S-box-containing protein